MSVVTRSELRDLKYPTPFEVHFATSHKEDFLPGKAKLDVTESDPDLAAHFTITKARGVTLYGEPIDETFPEVPPQYYLDSIAKDSEWSFGCVDKGPDSGTCRVPPYAVLNFCRVLAFIQEGLITSKSEGALWGLRTLPQEYRPLIEEALQEYRVADSSKEVDAALLKRFAKFAIEIIRKDLELPT
jgi:streptomycin 3"-adenylyltransferase